MTGPSTPSLCYIDTSAFLRRAFADDGATAIDAAITHALDHGGTVVSSRLLWLESQRVAIRERLLGNDVTDIVMDNLSAVTKLPVTEEVWGGAAAIDQHIKTLDALHLATCELVGADLVTVDAAMRSVARARGIPVLP